ncbi:MAG: hypothetical protein JNL01_16930 [Bdellovibrionales bacterium]|nr:hypothetical protein [Bdellovibrionales bacterium]
MTGARFDLGSRFLFAFSLALSTGALGCSSFTLRPVQLMSDTAAALKAAREVKADTLAPELFRQSSEWYVKSKREYQLKNYAACEQYARKAKFFAEQAEYEAVKNGASRIEFSAPDPLADTALAPSKKPADVNRTSGPVYQGEGQAPMAAPSAGGGMGGMGNMGATGGFGMDPLGGMGGSTGMPGAMDPMGGSTGMPGSMDPMGGSTGMPGGAMDPMMDPTLGTGSNMGTPGLGM